MQDFSLHLSYDEKSPSGLVWKCQKSKNVKCYGRAGYKTKANYWVVQIDGESYRAHRIIWFIFHGEIQHGMEIDHIDGNGLNNKIDNLRLCSRSENLCNRSRPKNNTSGVNGVHFCSANKAWIAKVKKGGKLVFKKSFKTFAEAVRQVIAAREVHHGDFAK